MSDILNDDVAAVLLVTADGDPLQLLATNPCGGRPSGAWLRHHERIVHEGSWSDTTYPVEKCIECGQPWPCDEPGVVEQEPHSLWVLGAIHNLDALVLAVEGKRIPDAIFRAWHRADDVLYMADDDNGLSSALDDSQSLHELVGVVSTWKRDGELIGELVLLDSTGAVVKHE